jgi:parallel beta-helix repeat protein
MIQVYPGTYDSRRFTLPRGPHWGNNDQYAPALIVWKNDLSIKAMDPDPSKTVIQTTHDWWSNPVAIQASTGGTWDGSKYINAGVNPLFGTAPNAVAVIADGLTITGLTLRKPDMGLGYWNTAGIMIGGLYAGDTFHLGSDGATVRNCVFKDCWHGVYIWHSSNNKIVNNKIEALGGTGHWAAISIYDGYNDAQINLGYTSKYNRIINNDIADKGIGVGAWAPPTWADNRGTHIHGNSAVQIGITYSSGTKTISGNDVYGVWTASASDCKIPGNSNHKLHV